MKGEVFAICLCVVKVKEEGENGTTVVMGVGKRRYNRVNDGREWVSEG